MTTLKKIKGGGKDKYLGMLTKDELEDDKEPEKEAERLFDKKDNKFSFSFLINKDTYKNLYRKVIQAQKSPEKTSPGKTSPEKTSPGKTSPGKTSLVEGTPDVPVDNSILSNIRKIIPDISQNKKYLTVGALALGLSGFGLNKYQNMKISQKQKKEIEDLRNKEIKIFEEKLKKMKLDKEQKKEMIRYFLLYSIGAILIGSTIRHLKKGGSSKKKTKFFSKKNKNNNKSVKKIL